MYKFLIFIVSCTVFFSSCSNVNSSYSPDYPIVQTSSKKDRAIEVLNYMPTRAAFRIGIITVSGNGFASDKELVNEAKKIAKQHGGDFLLLENIGSEKRTIYSPGYSTYDANAYSGSYGYANYNGYGNAYSYSANGRGNYQSYGNYQASGYSVGPSVNTYYYPWRIFSLWGYRPSWLGLKFIGVTNTISGFHINSDAEEAGVRIGDVLLGIDGHDMYDSNILSHVMKIKPGDRVTITIRSNGKKIERIITALPNN